MDWKDLGGQLARAGAPIIGGALGGPLGGMLGGVVGNVLADALGTDATPEAVGKAIATATPAEVAEKLAAADAEHGLEPGLHELRPERLVVHAFARHGVERLEDRRRRRRRREQAERQLGDQLGIARLGAGRDLGRDAEALLARHREDAHLAGPMQRDHLVGDVGGEHRHLPGDQIRVAARRALVGDMDDVGRAGERLEQLAREVRHGARTGRAVGQLARVRLGVGGELLQVVGRHGGVDDDGRDRDRHRGDRREILRLVAGLAVERRDEDEVAGRAEQQRVAVGRAAGRHRGADDAAAAALVLDDDGAERGLDPLRVLAGDDVEHATGAARHDQADRPIRIALRGRRVGGEGRPCERTERQLQHVTS
nr:hypothetical protein [Rhodoplanes elegans]